MDKKLICLICEKKLIGRQTKYCCRNCGSLHWNKANKEKCKKSLREWGERNPDKLEEQTKKWLSKLSEEKRKDYFKRQKESIKKWRINNPKKWKAIQRRKRVKEMKNKEKYSARRWDYLKREKECKHCGSINNLEFHHLNYQTREGITLCIKCHRNLHNTCKGVKKDKWDL